jgi:N-acetylglutamate synthase
VPDDSTPSSTPGTRVAVRYRLAAPDPVTGARLTDVTGTLVEASEARIVVDSRRGRVEVPRDRVVASRVIPPRPSRRGAPHRSLSVEDLERVMVGAWPPVEQERLGQWLLRSGHGFTARSNSVLAVGSPGLSLEDALGWVERWYAARALPALLTIPLPTGARLADDEVAATALEAGWTAADPVLVMTAATRSVLTACGSRSRVPVEVTDTMGEEWYAGLTAYRTAPRPAAEAVLHGSPAQRFALLRDEAGSVVAIARLGVSDGWGGLGAMWVREDRRREGLATALVGALAAEAAGLGCVSLHLQVDLASGGAIATYEAVGFTTHHAYAYLREPAGPERAPGQEPAP